MDPWNPDQYLRFTEERSQAFFDLLELVRPEPGMRIVDLGCGTGNLTQILHERLRASETLGIDSSRTMLDRAPVSAAHGLTFRLEDIDCFEGKGRYDLVFSNSALHWLPDHPRLLERLTRALAEGGQIAVQVPASDDHPAYIAAADVARESPFREALGGYTRPVNVLRPEAYAALLNDLGYKDQHVRLQVYNHPLPSREEVVEWLKGGLLTGYQRRMPPELFDDYVARYRTRLLSVLEDKRPFFFLFKRILFWALR